MPLSIRSVSVVGFVRPVLTGLLVFVVASLLGGAAPAPHAPRKATEDVPPVPNAEVRFIDGGVLKVKVLDAEVPLKTPYGKLVIPFDKVHEIECSTRVPAALAK